MGGGYLYWEKEFGGGAAGGKKCFRMINLCVCGDSGEFVRERERECVLGVEFVLGGDLFFWHVNCAGGIYGGRFVLGGGI